MFFAFCNIVATHAHTVTLVSHDFSQLLLLDHCYLETAYPTVNMFQVINKEARAT